MFFLIYDEGRNQQLRSSVSNNSINSTHNFKTKSLFNIGFIALQENAVIIKIEAYLKKFFDMK